jgi:hypothetical protein
VPRADAAGVKGLISTKLTDLEIKPFLDTAAVVVSEHLDGAGLSEALLTQIELWLAAHLVAVRDPRAAEKTVEDLRIRYEGRSAIGAVDASGLHTTSYGKQVMLLDPTGRLAQLMNPQRRPWRFRAGAPASS